MSELTTDPKNKKKALGRGLGSLLGGPVEAPPSRSEPSPAPLSKSSAAQSREIKEDNTPVLSTEGKVWQVSIEKVNPGIYQPRQIFTKEPLEELAQSIRQNGILQPLIVRKTSSGGFELVAGERRWRAAQLAGMHQVPVIIKDYSDKEALELAIVENIQREDLAVLEEADGYHRLMTEFNLSQQEVAERVGKDRATVANLLRVRTLPQEIKKMIDEKFLSLGHAKVLLSISDVQRQISMAKSAAQGKWSVRKLEKALSAPLAQESKNPEAPESQVMQRLIEGLGEEVQKLLGTKVSIDYNQGRGKIAINFYSDEELTHLIDKLKEAFAR